MKENEKDTMPTGGFATQICYAKKKNRERGNHVRLSSLEE
jgi:hypothetical protein